MNSSPSGTQREGDQANLFDLSGRVALVTGSTRGLGLAIAGALAGYGADIIVVGRKQHSCDAAAKEIARATGQRVAGLACHVGKWADIDRFVDAVYRQFDTVDVLVNNAGMSPMYPSVDAVTEDLWDKVLGVNLKGPFRLTALIGTRMVRAGGGSIINISSTGARKPTGDIIPYAAAKAGLEAMTVGFANALGPTVRVNAIQPGPFLTDVAKSWDMVEYQRRIEATSALRRFGEPSEIVGSALFLASSASSFTTGSVIRVDGGTF